MKRPTEIDATEVEAILDMVDRRSGLVFSGPARRAASERVTELAAACGLGAGDGYRRALDADAALLAELYAALVVGETYFFRDHEQLARAVHWSLAGVRGGPVVPVPLRVWCAGCSSGEEGYTLAMLLADAGAAGSTVVGTDLSAPALRKAERGVFCRNSLRGDGADLARRYLEPCAKGWRVPEYFRRRVSFLQHNLAAADFAAPPGAPFDLICCRNVLIYLSEAATAQVVAHLAAALAPGGLLVTSSMDPHLDQLPGLARLGSGDPFYRLRPAALAAAGAAHCPTVTGRGPRVAASAAAPRVAASAARGTTQAPPQSSAARPTAAEAIQRVRALCTVDPEGAAAVAMASMLQHPLVPELPHYVALLHLGLGQPTAALAALRRLLYLDHGSPVGHFLLGAALAAVKDFAGARSAYAAAAALAAGVPAGQPLPLGDGQAAGELVAAARAAIAQLDRAAP